jgi:hypothetical protein
MRSRPPTDQRGRAREWQIRTFKVTPEDAGLSREAEDCVANAEHNAKALLDVLKGKRSAFRDVAVLNAAAAPSWQARQRILNRAALAANRSNRRSRRPLERLISVSNAMGAVLSDISPKSKPRRERLLRQRRAAAGSARRMARLPAARLQQNRTPVAGGEYPRLPDQETRQGLIRADFDPRLRQSLTGGAACISVLTDAPCSGHARVPGHGPEC